MKYLCKNCSCNSMLLQHDNPSLFTKSQWDDGDYTSYVYVCYRWLLVLFTVPTLILSVVFFLGVDSSSRKKSYWLIYLTHWGFLILTLHFILDAILVTQRSRAERKEGYSYLEALPLSYRISWLLANTAFPVACGITFTYWTFIYSKDQAVGFFNVASHFLNSVLSIVDIFITARPWRILHFYQPVVFAAIYVIFTAIYWTAGGTDPNENPGIYPILNWENPDDTLITIAFGVVTLPITFILLWGLYTFRMFIYNKYLRNVVIIASEKYAIQDAQQSSNIVTKGFDNPVFA